VFILFTGPSIKDLKGDQAMSIIIDNARNHIHFGTDTELLREGANALSTPGSFKAAQLIAGSSGVKFSDNSVQTTAVVVPTVISGFTNDAGYQTAAQVATAISGKANTSSLAAVALSGAYSDLSGTPSIPSAYTLPVASSSVLGGVKQGTGVTIAGDGTISASGGTGGGVSKVYDTTCRYPVNTTTGQSVWVATSAPVTTGLSWAQTSTNLVITDNGHGHSVGEMVIVHNANVEFQNGLITAVTTNTFTITSSGTGGSSGTAAAYSMGYTFAHNASGVNNINAGILTAPAGVSNITLLGMRIHLATGTRTGTSYNLTIPVQPTGAWSSFDNAIVPVQQVRQDGVSLSAVGNTIAVVSGTSWNMFQYGALPASTTGIVFLMSF
jgi:hypothetical protein